MTGERGAVERLVQALVPGSNLIGVRRLKGGIGARMHVLSLRASDGERSRVVLRRYVPGRGDHGSPEVAAREFRTLQLLEAKGVAAPRPLLLDLDCRYFEVPTIVESLVPGRTVVTPRDFEAWTAGLAAALLRLHQVTPRTAALSYLRTFRKEGMQGELAKGLAGHSSRRIDLRRNPLAIAAHEALTLRLDSVAWLPATLVHDDYYPGNVLWYRGRVSGVVDWTMAEVGDRRADVAQCFVDLALMQGLEVADRFVAHYERLHGLALPDLSFWKLFRGIRAYSSHPSWLPGYHDLGLTNLAEPDLKLRCEAVLKAALAEIRILR